MSKRKRCQERSCEAWHFFRIQIGPVVGFSDSRDPGIFFLQGFGTKMRICERGIEKSDVPLNLPRVLTMAKTDLMDTDFSKLSDSEQGGFLGKKAKVVALKAGQGLYKLSSYPVAKGRTGYLSPWWAPTTPFQEDKLGARGRYLEAVANGVSMREMVRFASAVRIDWNEIEEYQEITLQVDAMGFWGQFEPQPASSPVFSGATANKSIFDMSFAELSGSVDQMCKNAAARKRLQDLGVYIPNTLGGLKDSWQVYVPNLQESDVSKTPSISSHDMTALALHFGIV